MLILIRQHFAIAPGSKICFEFKRQHYGAAANNLLHDIDIDSISGEEMPRRCSCRHELADAKITLHRLACRWHALARRLLSVGIRRARLKATQ